MIVADPITHDRVQKTRTIFQSTRTYTDVHRRARKCICMHTLSDHSSSSHRPGCLSGVTEKKSHPSQNDVDVPHDYFRPYNALARAERLHSLSLARRQHPRNRSSARTRTRTTADRRRIPACAVIYRFCDIYLDTYIGTDNLDRSVYRVSVYRAAFGRSELIFHGLPIFPATEACYPTWYPRGRPSIRLSARVCRRGINGLVRGCSLHRSFRDCCPRLHARALACTRPAVEQDIGIFKFNSYPA